MTAQEIASPASNLITVSPAALKLVGLLEQPSAGNDEVVDVLKHDTVLTAKLLKACNAASLGFAEEIGSVDQALLLLGYQPTLQMVLALAFGDALSVPMPGYAVEAKELWRHSLIVAMACELLTSHFQQADIDPGVTFTAGLLHDIGKMALSQHLDAKRQATVRQRVAEGGVSRVEAEKEILGTDHAEVGACLLNGWRLPRQIVAGVAHHHDPECEGGPDLSTLIYVANCSAHLAGSAPGWEAYALKIQGRAAKAFHLTTEKLDNLLIQIRESCDRVDFLMGN